MYLAMYIIFHGMMMIVGQRQITVTGLNYIEILKKLIKLTSSIVSDPWCNLDAASLRDPDKRPGKRDAHAGFL